MAGGYNSIEPPTQPSTGTPLMEGYDEAMWLWTQAIETMSIDFRAELLARMDKLGVGSGGGTAILYAKITAVTDANNYTASIYKKSDLTDTPVESKSVYVMSIIDELVANNVIPVQASSISGKDYEATQQLGVLG